VTNTVFAQQVMGGLLAAAAAILKTG